MSSSNVCATATTAGAFFPPDLLVMRQNFSLIKQFFLDAAAQAHSVKRAAQPGVASRRVAALVLACAAVVAWTHPSPRAEVLAGGKLLHLRPRLGQHCRRAAVLDPRHRLQQLPLPIQARLADLG